MTREREEMCTRNGVASGLYIPMAFGDDRPSITFGHVQRWNSRWSLFSESTAIVSISNVGVAANRYFTPRGTTTGGWEEVGGRPCTLWHDGGRKNSLSSAPRRPLILLSFRSHGIYSRALFSEDLTKKLRPSNSFESRRAYREIINCMVRDATRRVVCFYCSTSRKSREKVANFGHVPRLCFRHINRVFFELPSPRMLSLNVEIVPYICREEATNGSTLLMTEWY